MAGKKVATLFIDIRAKTKQFSDSLENLSKQLNKQSRKMQRIGRTMAQGISAPLAAIGGSALLAGKQFDDAFRTIRVGTGATGKSLAGLKKDFMTIARVSPNAIGDVATAVADLNTRLGIAGKPLQDLSKQFLNLSKITGEGTGESIKKVTQAFGQWQVASTDQASTLDFLFRVSQATGIGVSDLSDKLMRGGVAFKELGFSLEESAALLGKFQKEGINVDGILSGLKISLGTLKKAGLDPAKVFGQLVDEFKRTGDQASLSTNAIKIFGTRAGPELARAIGEGRFEIAEFLKTLKESDETIAKAAAESETFSDKLMKLKNAVTVALGPLGALIMDEIGPAVQGLAGFIGALAEKFSSLSPQTKQAIVVFGMIAAAAGPVVFAVGKIGAAFALVLNPITLTVAAIAASVAVVVAWRSDILRILDDFEKNAKTALKGFADAFPAVAKEMQELKRIALGIFKEIPGAAADMAREVKRIFVGIFHEIVGMFEGGIDFIVGLIPGANAAINKWARSIAEVQVELDKQNKTLAETAPRVAAVATETGKATTEVKKQGEATAATAEKTEDFSGSLEDAIGKLGGAGGAAGKAADEIARLGEQFKQSVENIRRDELRSAIDDAIESLDRADFEKFTGQLREAIEGDVAESFSELLSAGTITTDQLKDLQKRTADQVIGPLNEQFKDGQIAAVTEAAERQRELFEENARAFEDLFVSIGESIGGSFGKTFKEIFSIISKQFKGTGGGSGVGGILAGLLGGPNGQISGQFTDAIGGLFRGDGFLNNVGGALFGRGRPEGVARPLLPGGEFTPGLFSTGPGGLFQGAGSTVSVLGAVASSIDSLGRIGSSTEGTISGLSESIGTIGGAFLGGPLGSTIGSALGKTVGKLLNKAFGSGPTNPETLARIAGVDAVNEVLKRAGGLSFFGANGQMVRLDQFSKDDISKKFQGGRGFREFEEQFGTDALVEFAALGDTLTKILGLTEDVGGQLGIMFGEQLQGQIEGMGALFELLGVKTEELTQQMIDAGLSGEKSWLEVEIGLRAIGKASGTGLKAVGAFDLAFQGLLATAGRGSLAIGALQNIAIEAKEAGIETMEEFRDRLLATGKFTETQVEALFKGFADFGINSMEDLENASVRTLGGIVAAMDAFFQDAGTSFADVASAVSNIPAQTSTRMDFDLRTQMDENTAAALEGGAFRAAGVAAVENLTQMTSPGGPAMVGKNPETGSATAGIPEVGASKMGQTNITNITVDARGAEASASRRIRQEIERAGETYNRNPGAVQ